VVKNERGAWMQPPFHFFAIDYGCSFFFLPLDQYFVKFSYGFAAERTQKERGFVFEGVS
jgi:hypothetical protein